MVETMKTPHHDDVNMIIYYIINCGCQSEGGRMSPPPHYNITQVITRELDTHQTKCINFGRNSTCRGVADKRQKTIPDARETITLHFLD